MSKIVSFKDFIFEAKEIHKETKNLYVAQSSISGAGKGLFTKVSFKKGEVISYFVGKLLTEKECEDLANNSDLDRGSYFIDLKAIYKKIWNRKKRFDKPVLDVYDSTCMAKFANDAEGLFKTNRKNNSEISITEDGKRCFMRTTKDITAGSEIFLSYGDQYWEAYAEHI